MRFWFRGPGSGLRVQGQSFLDLACQLSGFRVQFNLQGCWVSGLQGSGTRGIQTQSIDRRCSAFIPLCRSGLEFRPGCARLGCQTPYTSLQQRDQSATYQAMVL